VYYAQAFHEVRRWNLPELTQICLYYEQVLLAILFDWNIFVCFLSKEGIKLGLKKYKSEL
jgi:hypothetical protein